MKDKILIKELQSLREIKKPASVWRDKTRNTILSLAEQKPMIGWGVSDRVLVGWFDFRLKFAPVPAVAVVTMLLVMAFITLPLTPGFASSVPGDFAYPLKRLEEKIQLSLRQNSASQGIYYLKLADRRLSELKAIPIGSEDQVALLRDYNINLSFAEANYRAVANNNELAKVYDQVAKKLGENLNQIIVTNGSKQVYQVARELTDKISSDSLATLIVLHQQGQTSNQQVVQERLQEEIDKVEQKLATVQTKLGELSAPKRNTSKVVIESRRAVVPATEAGEEASKNLAEAKILLEQKEFSLALAKVKEGEVITLKTEEAISEEDVGQPDSVEGEVRGETQIIDEPTVAEPVTNDDTVDFTLPVDSGDIKVEVKE
ncbi:MAG: DUF5667 domain-containing protein [Patescibacteria group bacterium]